MYAEVAVNSAVPHRRIFSYSIPPGMRIEPGSAVYVPFGKKRLFGVVMSVGEETAYPETRDVAAVIGEAPLVPRAQAELSLWAGRHYLSSMFDAVALTLPPGFQSIPQALLRPLATSGELDSLKLPPRQRLALEALIAAGVSEEERLLTTLGAQARFTLGQLERRGLVVREYAQRRAASSPAAAAVVRLAVSAEEALAAADAVSGSRRSRRANLLDRLAAEGPLSLVDAQQTITDARGIDRLERAGLVEVDRKARTVRLSVSRQAAVAAARKLRLVWSESATIAALTALADARDVPLAELRRRTRIGVNELRALVERGIAVIEQRAAEAAVSPMTPDEPSPLPSQYEDPLRRIESALESRAYHKLVLRDRSAGDRCELHLRAAESALALGRSAVVVVPEAAAMAAVASRFETRFPERAVALPASLTANERAERWWRIREAGPCVVVGGRSALFAPAGDAGLVIVDDAGSDACKRQDRAPCFDARAAAERLAEASGAAVVLASASPDVLRQAQDERPEPEVLEIDGARAALSIVDVRGGDLLFALEVAQALRDCGRAIVLASPHGAALLRCVDCGHVPRCRRCGSSPAVLGDSQLMCHLCGVRSRTPNRCGECGGRMAAGASFAAFDAELRRLLPAADIVSASGPSGERVLARFESGEGDVLLTASTPRELPAGVSMLVIADIDPWLHLPDFRAAERAHHMLSRMTALAGGSVRVAVQTRSPDHHALSDGFLERELDVRESRGLPPYGGLVRLAVAHAGATFAREEADRVAALLREERERLALEDVELFGPSPALPSRAGGRHRWQIVAKGPDPALLLRDIRLPTHWLIDVDPVALA